MAVRPKLTLQRTFRAPIERVWELWTTRHGIESWWGPDMFAVSVRDIDLRAGGHMHYVMAAIGADQIEFMKKAGMPVSTEHLITFTEVEPPRRLAYRELVDFVPGLDKYEVEAAVDLEEIGDSTRLVVTFDAMHDERWTELATRGREMELDRLGKVLGAPATR